MTASLHRAIRLRVGAPMPGHVRVWTLQALPVWEALQQGETLYVDPARSENVADFREAYRWMCTQMRARLADYQGHLPWWAWHTPKPDLRTVRWRYPADISYVRLELTLPPERVLLSDRTGWVSVLNGYYLAFSATEAQAWERELAAQGISYPQWPLPEPWHSRVLQSWERIFDLNALQAHGWSPDRLQATFERLEPADVVEATTFWGCCVR